MQIPSFRSLCALALLFLLSQTATGRTFTADVVPYEVTGTTEDLTLTEPNTLRYVLSDLESTAVGALTLHGPLGSDDLSALRDNGRLTNLQVLDLSDATLVADEGWYVTHKTARSDIGFGTTTTMWYLSEREETERTSSSTGLGGAKVTERVYTMSLGGLLAGIESLRKVLLPKELRKVGSFLCNGCTGLVDVVLPSGIGEVEECAFNGCTNLRTVNLDALTAVGDYAFFSTLVRTADLSRVTALGANAFRNSLLEQADLSALTAVPDNAFKGCTNLHSVTFGQNITEIGESAFDGTALTALRLPEGLTHIGTAAFSGSAVADIPAVPSTLRFVGREAFRNTPWILGQTGTDGVVYLGTIALGGDIHYELNPTIRLREGTTALAEDFVDYYIYSVNADYTRSTANISENYFNSISLPASLRVVGDYAVSGHYTSASRAVQYTLPEGLEYIGERAFSYNTAMTTLTIPASVAHIGDQAFRDNTSLLNVRYDAPAANGEDLFRSCTALEKVTFGPDVRLVPEGAFSGCSNLLKVTFEQNAASGDGALALVFADRCFEGCTLLRSMDFPARTDSIGYSAFSATGLTTANLIGGVRSIGKAAFDNCASLTTVLLPKNIQRLAGTAFDRTTLTAIYSYATTPPTVDDKYWSFRKLAATATVYVHPDCLYVYDADPVWTNFIITPMDDAHLALSVGSVRAEAASGATEYYDLSGRRAVRPTKGVYVTPRGGKVMR